MSVEVLDVIITYMKSDTNLSNTVQERIYPDVIPKNSELPSICYHLISEFESEVMTGHDLFFEMVLQFDIKGKNKSIVRMIKNYIIEVWRNKREFEIESFKITTKMLGSIPGEFAQNEFIEKYEIKFYY